VLLQIKRLSSDLAAPPQLPQMAAEAQGQAPSLRRSQAGSQQLAAALSELGQKLQQLVALQAEG
jgi:hypothetical protein